MMRQQIKQVCEFGPFGLNKSELVFLRDGKSLILARGRSVVNRFSIKNFR